MLNGMKYLNAGFVVAAMTFSVSALSWNPLEWFQEERKEVRPAQAPSFLEEQLQNFQKSSYYDFYQKADACGRQGAHKAYQQSIQLVHYVKQHPLEASAVISTAASIYLLYN